LSATGWGWMGFIVIFATLLTYFLNTYALKLLPASTVSLYVQLQPIATIAFSHWILQETVTLGMILNGFIICLGVTLATGAYRPIKQLFFKSPA
jgi:drug/metabolite transporter (DMT)-like permease